MKHTDVVNLVFSRVENENVRVVFVLPSEFSPVSLVPAVPDAVKQAALAVNELLVQYKMGP